MNKNTFKKLKLGPVRDSYNISTPDGNQLVLTESPFCNCQMFTLGNAVVLTRETPEELKKTIEDILSSVSKRLMMIDINQVYKKYFEDNFKDYIIMNCNYTSTSKSKMCIMIINVWDRYNT